MMATVMPPTLLLLKLRMRKMSSLLSCRSKLGVIGSRPWAVDVDMDGRQK